jgi:hypothetical protein
MTLSTAKESAYCPGRFAEDAVVTLEAIRLFDQAAGTPAALFAAASRRHALLRSGCSSRARIRQSSYATLATFRDIELNQ